MNVFRERRWNWNDYEIDYDKKLQYLKEKVSKIFLAKDDVTKISHKINNYTEKNIFNP